MFIQHFLEHASDVYLFNKQLVQSLADDNLKGGSDWHEGVLSRYMKKSKAHKAKKPTVSGAWLTHLQEIAQSKTAAKSEACRENLAKAREAKMMKRLGLVWINPDVGDE